TPGGKALTTASRARQASRLWTRSSRRRPFYPSISMKSKGYVWRSGMVCALVSPSGFQLKAATVHIGLTPASAKSRYVDFTTVREKLPTIRLTWNSVTVIFAIAVLVFVLIFLEFRIRSLTTIFADGGAHGASPSAPVHPGRP